MSSDSPSSARVVPNVLVRSCSETDKAAISVLAPRAAIPLAVPRLAVILVVI